MLAGTLYFSLAEPGLTDARLSEIVKAARDQNALHGITGQLHHENGLFLQWIEGPAGAIETLWSKLFLDRRHSRITKMYAGPVTARRFGSWDMQFTDSKDGYLFDFVQSRNVSLVDRTKADVSKLVMFLHDVATTERYRPLDSIKVSEATRAPTVYFVSRRVAAA